MTTVHRMTAAAALLAGLAAAGAASAQDGPHHMGGMGGGHPELAFEAIDSDDNGALSRAELVARASERLARLDANGDAALDRAEIIDASPGPHGGLSMGLFLTDPAEEYADRLLATMGATEAGRIEVQALAERRVNDLLAWIDTDRDSAVSTEEVEAVRARHADRMERRHGGMRHGGGDGDDDGDRDGGPDRN